MSRSNLRQKPRSSYYEPDCPNVDEYIFCDECEDYVYEYCSIHGPLLVIPDNKVPPSIDLPPCIPRAALTIPHVFLHLARSSIPGAGLGVFTTLTLPRGVRFGPYVGTRKTQPASPYCWQIYDGHNRPLHVVDASDAGRSNWLRYVNCARHASEQNLVAFQYQGQLYYRTIKLIPRYTELLVFYGTEFARALRVDLKHYNSPRKYVGFTPPAQDAPKPKKAKQNKNTIEENSDQKHTTQESSSTDTNTETIVPVDTECGTSDADSKRKTKKIIKSKNKLDAQKNKPGRTSKDVKTPPNLKSNKNNNFAVNKIIPSVTKGYSCDICEYTTNSEPILNANLKAHAASKRFSCDLCLYITSSKQSIESHIRTHTGEKLHTCNICDKMFSLKPHLDAHILRIHTGKKPYSCNLCDKKFNGKRNLDRHLRIHTGEKPHSCNVCYKKFSDKSAFVKHLRIHTGEKPYSCNVCDKKFNQKKSLDTHLRIHTGEKPYSCNVCDKKFNVKYNLDAHLRIHTGEKPYSCTVCDKKFNQKQTLDLHLRTHTGVKSHTRVINEYLNVVRTVV